MTFVFESEEAVDKQSIIREIHTCWSQIYGIAGLNSNISSEALRFAATLKKAGESSQVLNEGRATESLFENLKLPDVMNISEWIKK